MPKWLAAFSAIGLTACSLVGIRGEAEPKYRVVAQVGVVEIREYGPRIAAETTVLGDEYAARSAGFRRIAGYIFGGNRTKQSIAMTAPVAFSQKIDMTAPVAQQRDASGAWVVRFFMPADLTMETLPRPNDSSVRLVTIPSETVAVLRFSGATTPSAVAEHKAVLLKGLADGPWKPQGEPVAWFYDPPWTLPFLRRNEVAVVVTKS